MNRPRFNASAISPERDSPAAAAWKPAPESAMNCVRWIQDSKVIGLVCCVLMVERSGSVMEKAGPGFERILGEKLETAQLGVFEDTEYDEKFLAFYLLPVDRWITAAKFIQQELAALQILADCEIACADPETNTWKRFYPANDSPANS